MVESSSRGWDGFGIVVVVVVVVAGNESKLSVAVKKREEIQQRPTPRPFRVYVNLVLLQRDGSSERSLTEYEPSHRIA